MMSRQSLTVYLIKDTYSSDEQCIRQEERGSLDKYEIELNEASYACIYARKNAGKLPEWKSIFPEIDWKKYKTNTFSGLLLVDISERRFAITSGSGRFLLDPFSIEENFGFKTVINSADPKTIRKIEKKTIDQNPLNSIEQLTRVSSLQDFHIDYYTDIVSKVRASSTFEELGSVIDGRDSIQISIEQNSNEITNVLKICLKSFSSKAYKKYFPNIDNIGLVNDKELINALDNELVVRLNNGNYDRCWAAIPEIIQDENFDVFQYSRREGALRYHDVELQNCLEKYKNTGKQFTKSDLERDEIYIRTLDGDVFPKWHIWKCIYAEIHKDRHLYILIDGKWYRVDQNFINRIDDKINEIPIAKYELPNWKQHEQESDYLKTVGDGYKVLDQDLVRVEGQSPIELCDLFFPERTFIHVKRYGSSEVLSHLFNQGKVSAKLLLEDRRFREKAREKFDDVAPFDVDERPDPRAFSIVFLIGSIYGSNQALPLFARVVLVNVFDELSNYGFKIELGFIQIDLI